MSNGMGMMGGMGGMMAGMGVFGLLILVVVVWSSQRPSSTCFSTSGSKRFTRACHAMSPAADSSARPSALRVDHSPGILIN